MSIDKLFQRDPISHDLTNVMNDSRISETSIAVIKSYIAKNKDDVQEGDIILFKLMKMKSIYKFLVIEKNDELDVEYIS